MPTFVQVLVLELDETEGDPADWNWVEMIDTFGSALALSSVEIVDMPTREQVAMLHTLTTDYGRALQDQLGTTLEV